MDKKNLMECFRFVQPTICAGSSPASGQQESKQSWVFETVDNPSDYAKQSKRTFRHKTTFKGVMEKNVGKAGYASHWIISHSSSATVPSSVPSSRRSAAEISANVITQTHLLTVPVEPVIHRQTNNLARDQQSVTMDSKQHVLQQALIQSHDQQQISALYRDMFAKLTGGTELEKIEKRYKTQKLRRKILLRELLN